MSDYKRHKCVYCGRLVTGCRYILGWWYCQRCIDLTNMINKKA